VEDLRLVLHDGEVLTIASDDVERICENLWRLAPKPGAVTLVGVLVAASRDQIGVLASRPVELTEPQGAILREALAMPPPEPTA
jgi:hypothetical protein